MNKRPLSLAKLRKVPSQFSWVDQRLVRERYIDQLSPEACALYLFLVTVADAQGLSYYAERSLGSSTLNRGGVRLQRKRGSRHIFSWHAPQHNQERRIVMDPTTVFCPNLACSARGHIGQGNIGIHSQKDRRFICTQCRKTFSATKGTVF